jgi:hypothetical protein
MSTLTAPKTDCVEEALDWIRRAPDPDAALAAFLERALEVTPHLGAYSAELLRLVRSVMLSENVASSLAGEPSDLSDVIHIPVPTPEDILAEAALFGQVRRRILGFPMLTTAAVSEILGSTSVNKRQYANALRRRGDLVAVPHRNQYLFPAFQIDVKAGCIRPCVPDVNRLLDAAGDPWGVASWWLLPHGALEPGRAPADLLTETAGPARVTALAASELEPVG